MRVRLIFGHNPGPWTGRGSNTWLIEGGTPTLIDCGSGASEHVDELAATVDQQAAPLSQVLVTHAHPDHAGGAPALAARWPDLRFSKYPWPERDAQFDVTWNWLRDGELVSAGDGQLWVVHTPGHAPDHLCFFEPHTGTVFAGDLVVNGGTVVIPASHGGSVSDYLRSLGRILELQPRRILPGHGPAIDQPMALLRGYIAHRRSREQQIVEALRSAPATVSAIVAAVYPGLSPDLTAAAHETVLAHLRKLEEEQRATPDEEGDVLHVPWRLLER